MKWRRELKLRLPGHIWCEFKHARIKYARVAPICFGCFQQVVIPPVHYITASSSYVELACLRPVDVAAQLRIFMCLLLWLLGYRIPLCISGIILCCYILNSRIYAAIQHFYRALYLCRIFFLKYSFFICAFLHIKYVFIISCNIQLIGECHSACSLLWCVLNTWIDGAANGASFAVFLLLLSNFLPISIDFQ